MFDSTAAVPPIVGLTSVIVLGVGAQWLAWRLRWPSILLLLLTGIAAGPVTGLLDTKALFGPSLVPFVSLCVALILFEGGLQLKFSDLRSVGRVFLQLLFVGCGLTWLLAGASAYFVLGLSWTLAVLLGALLTVTGPTVIGPLLRDVRPTARVASLLKWEGIAIDPLGASLAVLVYETVGASPDTALSQWLLGLVKTTAVGLIGGWLAAHVVIATLRRYLAPDYLQSPVALALVLLGFTASNLVQSESGLLTVTVMGIVLANTKGVNTRPLIEFKENLRVLLISSVFILLGARITASDLASLDLRAVLFVLSLILIVRPVSVWAATIGGTLSWGERIFMMSIAPRGVVLAAVTAIFALKLEPLDPTATRLVPVAFLVIILSVSIYGLSARPLAHWLRVAQPNPQGVLFVGAHSWARQLAQVIQRMGFRVVLLDTNFRNAINAQAEGLLCQNVSVTEEGLAEELDLSAIGRLVALTPNEEANSLASLHFTEVFGRAEVYQLLVNKPAGEAKEPPPNLRGRLVAGADVTFGEIDRRFEAGARFSTVRLAPNADAAVVLQRTGDRAIPFAVITESGQLQWFTADGAVSPRPGQTLVVFG